MVLNNIADGAGLIVERAPALDTKVFSHGDLHALYIIAIPERLRECVGKTEDHHVVYRPLTQIMVDPENLAFIEMFEKNFIEVLRGCQIMTEGLLDNDPGARHATTH